MILISSAWGELGDREGGSHRPKPTLATSVKLAGENTKTKGRFVEAIQPFAAYGPLR